MPFWIALWSGEAGQDLVEYVMLVAFVVVLSGAIYLLNFGGLAGIVGSTDRLLTAAQTAAS